jgi:hypothetical protein
MTGSRGRAKQAGGNIECGRRWPSPAPGRAYASCSSSGYAAGSSSCESPALSAQRFRPSSSHHASPPLSNASRARDAAAGLMSVLREFTHALWEWGGGAANETWTGQRRPGTGGRRRWDGIAGVDERFLSKSRVHTRQPQQLRQRPQQLRQRQRQRQQLRGGGDVESFKARKRSPVLAH